MRLEQVSRFFDRTPMWDAYTGQKLRAKCQVVAWDSPRRDGLTTLRRTFYMRYGSLLPTRRAVVVGGEAWLVATDPSGDSFGAAVTRVGYVAQQAHLGKAGTTAEVLANGGTAVYLSRVWIKDVKDITTTSESQSQYYIYFTPGEPVQVGQFLQVDGQWHICRNILSGAAGLMVAECNELEPDCFVSVRIPSTGTWDPITETYIGGSDLTLQALLLNWRDDYTHELPSFDKEQVGDIRLRFAPADAVHLKQDTRIEFRGDKWQLASQTKRSDDSVSAVFRRVT